MGKFGKLPEKKSRVRLASIHTTYRHLYFVEFIYISIWGAQKKKIQMYAILLSKKNNFPQQMINTSLIRKKSGPKSTLRNWPIGNSPIFRWSDPSLDAEFRKKTYNHNNY